MGSFFGQFKWRIIAVAFGLLFMILTFTINFWRTLLLFVIVGFCYLIGMLMDQGGRERVGQFFHELFHKKDA